MTYTVLIKKESETFPREIVHTVTSGDVKQTSTLTILPKSIKI